MIAQLKNQGAPFSRRLSLLLVVFILYGTTVEAAHQHGRILPSTANAAANVDNPQTKNLTSKKSGCNDCLICQLHQNFSTTLISLRLNDPPIQLPQLVHTVVPQDLLSQKFSPLAGRGPPQAN